MKELPLWKVVNKKESLDGARQVEFDHSVREISAGDLKDYDLFLYKMKDRELFYQRDHYKNISPESFTFENYWNDFWKKCLEGEWINDKGTWVYFMPKLFYYVNYVKIIGNKEGDEDSRIEMSPDLSSLEWLQYSYLLLCDGFSGFEEDDIYTCNKLVWRLANGFSINKYQRKKLENCYQPNGELKIYVDPWEYLTRFYLVDNPSDKPLGKALYENSRENGIFMGSRGTAKSYCLYGGDLLHEWTFGGVRTFEERHKCSTRLLFAAGSGDSEPLERSLKIIDGFYDNQPGQFKYPNPDRPKYQGPFYKRVQGNWTSGVAHIVKNKQNKKTLTGSTLQVSVITPDRKKIGAGDRFRRLYVEECGFVGYLDQVHSANKDSTEIGKNKVGSSMYSGTSGDIHDVIGSKKLFENPGAYTIASIPNYWKNSDLSIGLFLSAIYKYREYKDPQGNNDLITALELLNEERKNNSEKMDSSAFDDYIMYAPIHPDEMLRPNRRAFLPVAQAQARLSDIDAYDYFNIHANLGDLRYNSGEKYGVEFRKDNEGKTRPIKEYNIDRSKIDLAGCYTIFEQPPEEIPEGLYWVVYDPVAKPGQGQSLDASLNVAVVYKYFYTGGEDTLEDSIVAEWVGREDDLYANYERVVKLAKYYNAKIFPETNTAGFVTWCYENGHGQLLQEEAYLAERELNPNYRKKGAVGFTITGDRKKPWLLQKLKSWLLYKRGHNKDTGDFHSYNIEHILSTRFLDEIVNFNEAAGNFDYISAMLGLMLLINQLDKEAVELVQPKEEQEIYYEKNINYVRRRSSFETY